MSGSRVSGSSLGPRTVVSSLRNLPPGLKPWPIIGNFDLIGALPHRSIHELSGKYGPLMHLRFGSFPVIVGSSVDMDRFFHKTQDILYADDPTLEVQHRETLVEKYAMSWAYANTGHRAASSVDAGNLVDLAPVELGNVMLFIVSDKIDEAELQCTETLLRLHGACDEEHHYACTKLPRAPRRLQLMLTFDTLMEHILDLDEHILGKQCCHEGEAARDMVDVLMDIADDPTLEVQYDRIGVMAFTQDLIAGGTESSAVTMEWAMSELMRRPAAFDAATEELDRVVGRDRWVTEKDMPNLPYIEAIVKESMRMHPIVPLLIPRMAREGATIDGYDIPKGARVLINVWAIGRDPELWDPPEEFMPERFLGSKMGVIGQDLELLPFGTGRRMCPGYNLGLKAVHLRSMTPTPAESFAFAASFVVSALSTPLLRARIGRKAEAEYPSQPMY
ncbi:dimethylnonatriene synthase-like [Triticum urartu]|nr:dimethylnonatriene synthase-like [Triticum urartu]